jgi:hypothetical protein
VVDPVAEFGGMIWRVLLWGGIADGVMSRWWIGVVDGVVVVGSWLVSWWVDVFES